MLDKAKVLAELDKVKELSTPPTILNEILVLLEKTDVSYKELSDIILKDPAITTRLLRIANSSFYGFPKEVTTINQAVMVMGVNAVKYFILSITVFNHLLAKKQKNKINQKQLWIHFLEVAVASKKIAEAINYELPEEAYVAGLLHDLGLILLETYLPDEYYQVVQRTAGGKQICEAEREVFGIDHQEVAGVISKRWNMPDRLIQPMNNHHLEKEEEIEHLSDLTKIVCLAESIAQVPFDELNHLNRTEGRLNVLTFITRALKIDFDILGEIHSKLPGEVVTSARMMELDLGDAVEILTQSNARLFDIYLEITSLFKERQELSKKLLDDERSAGILESLKISLATLSHYINNATMNIQGKCEIMRIINDQKDYKALLLDLPSTIESIEKSVKKISLVLEELSNISSLDSLTFFRHSKAIDIEKDVKEKLTRQFESAGVGQ
jgi:HD-like signal output (HDOD) protein